MAIFLPTRASPPSKHTRITERTAHKVDADISRSATSVPELTGLSRDEIGILDAVMNRAGPSATTFLAVFKAYNDVLSECGIDPHEVLYYGKLLKLGTMKGKNWVDKWNAVKVQHNYTSSLGPGDQALNGTQHKDNLLKRNSKHILQARPPASTYDPFTLHSHTSDSDGSSSTAGLELAPHQPQAYTITTGFEDLENKQLLSTPNQSRNIDLNQDKPCLWSVESSESEDYVTYTTPPSYRAATHSVAPHQQRSSSNHVAQSATAGIYPFSAITPPISVREDLFIAQARRSSVINEEDAWSKIRMQRDELEADEFRKDRLLERCWEVWRQGFRWIITTHIQIRDARDNLLLHITFQRWRNMATSRSDLYNRITNVVENRCRKKYIAIWRSQLNQKKQNKWRRTMRQKMMLIQQKREQTLRKDMWVKWCQLHQSYLSGQHYATKVAHRFYSRWKKKLSATEGLEAIADDAFQASQEKALVKYWSRWRIIRGVRNSERIIYDRVGLRLMADAMAIWRKNTQHHESAKEFYQLVLLRTSLKSWKASQGRMQAIKNRALKHVARQDGVLLRAVFRVWKARERGRLLQRVKAARLKKDIWSIWNRRIQQQMSKHDLAVAFSLRLDSVAVASAFRKWCHAHTTHRNAHSFAVQFDSAQLRYRMLLTWRINLREKLKMINMANMAYQFFAMRQGWKVWHDALNTKARERRAQEFKKRRTQTIFNLWRCSVVQQKQRRTAEKTINDRIIKRAKKDTLAIWTNRVIEIKLRELEVAHDSDMAIRGFAFKKWKAVLVRHVEALSLLENYLMVRREENMRRAFNRWLALTRITRHRRITLKQKEDEIMLTTIAGAWDRWRDRFSDERLRPIELAIVIQTQKNTSFRAFGIWHSKTKSLPAIRFHAGNLKTKHFELWRQAMPRALQAKEARQKDRKVVLTRYINRWIQTHRTKMALKAVARARYLKLPTATPRQPRIPPKPYPVTTSFPRPAVLPMQNIDQTLSLNRFNAYPGALRPLTTKPLSEKGSRSGKSAPGTREASPARSTVSLSGSVPVSSPTRPVPSSVASGGEPARSRLWLELREVQRRPRPSSLHSRTREPQ